MEDSPRLKKRSADHEGGSNAVGPGLVRDGPESRGSRDGILDGRGWDGFDSSSAANAATRNVIRFYAYATPQE